MGLMLEEGTLEYQRWLRDGADEIVQECLIECHKKCCSIVRNWHLLEETCNLNDWDVVSVLTDDNYVFYIDDGVCVNTKPLTFQDNIFAKMRFHEHFGKIVNEWTKQFSPDYATSGMFIGGVDEYTGARLYTNHKRLHFTIFFANKLHALIYGNKQ